MDMRLELLQSRLVFSNQPDGPIAQLIDPVANTPSLLTPMPAGNELFATEFTNVNGDSKRLIGWFNANGDSLSPTYQGNVDGGDKSSFAAAEQTAVQVWKEPIPNSSSAYQLMIERYDRSGISMPASIVSTQLNFASTIAGVSILADGRVAILRTERTQTGGDIFVSLVTFGATHQVGDLAVVRMDVTPPTAYAIHDDAQLAVSGNRIAVYWVDHRPHVRAFLAPDSLSVPTPVYEPTELPIGYQARSLAIGSNGAATIALMTTKYEAKLAFVGPTGVLLTPTPIAATPKPMNSHSLVRLIIDENGNTGFTAGIGSYAGGPDGAVYVRWFNAAGAAITADFRADPHVSGDYEPLFIEGDSDSYRVGYLASNLPDNASLPAEIRSFDDAGAVLPPPPPTLSLDFQSAGDEFLHVLSLRFGDGIAVSLDGSDVQVHGTTSTGAAIAVTASDYGFAAGTYSSGLQTNPGHYPIPLPDGTYAVHIARADVGDVYGNPLLSDVDATFTVYEGDATGDGIVNFQDLVILAQHYGQSGMSTSEGNVDFSSDGKVNFSDLVVLAQRYGTAYTPAALALPAMAAASSTSIGETRRRPTTGTPVAADVLKA